MSINWIEIEDWYMSGPFSLHWEVRDKFKLTRRQITKAIEAGELSMKSYTRRRADKVEKQRLNGTLYFTDGQKETLAKAMAKVVLEKPESYSSNSVCGRVKTYEFMGSKFKGTWELEIAKILTEEKIDWDRKVQPIPYMFQNRLHQYFPDFYLPEFNCHLEIKGYETDKDRAKWKNRSRLLVIKEKGFIELKSRQISMRRYLSREAGWLSD